MKPRDTRVRLRAGDLRHHVAIVAPAGTAGLTETILEAGVWCQISALPPGFQARERLGQGAQQSETVYTISMRYRTDVHAWHVLREECHTRRQFQILAVVPSDADDAIDLQCVTNG